MRSGTASSKTAQDEQPKRALESADVADTMAQWGKGPSAIFLRATEPQQIALRCPKPAGAGKVSDVLRMTK